MTQKNAFDFIERPSPPEDAKIGDSKKANSKGGAENVRKVMEALKRRNRASYTNKRLQLVKIDN